MNAEARTLKSQGYRMPAEWERQEATWLSWPSHPESWPEKAALIDAQFAQIAAAISRFQKVCINASASAHTHIQQILHTIDDPRAQLGRIHLYDHPNNDVWCRDHGPLFVQHEDTGTLAITDWGFNGWGDKFGPYDLDNAIPRRIGDTLDLPCHDAGMILEGGSIEVNSRGQLLTTEAVLLNPNRNPRMSREEIEQRLYSPHGSIFRFLSEEAEAAGGKGRAPDAVSFISAGIGFCFMTQFGRMGSMEKLDLPKYAIVQDTHFSLGGASGKTGKAGEADPVETHVHLTTEESDEIAQDMLDVSEKTCFLHAFCRTDLKTKLKITRV